MRFFIFFQVLFNLVFQQIFFAVIKTKTKTKSVAFYFLLNGESFSTCLKTLGLPFFLVKEVVKLGWLYFGSVVSMMFVRLSLHFLIKVVKSGWFFFWLSKNKNFSNNKKIN